MTTPSLKRRILRWGLLGVVALGLTTAGVGCLLSQPGYKGPRSAHFDGTRFINQAGDDPRKNTPTSKKLGIIWRILMEEKTGWEPFLCIGLLESERQDSNLRPSAPKALRRY